MSKANPDIAVDLDYLIRYIRRSMHCMNKADRVTLATPAMAFTVMAVADFEMAYDFKDQRAYYTDKFIAEFKAARRLCNIMVVENVISIGKDSQVIKRDIFDRIAKIDGQIGAWRGSVGKARPALNKGNGQADII